MMNKFCLYYHYKPNGEIFYVGIGDNKRPYDFINARNKFWHNIVEKYGNPIVKIILENISWEMACNEEKKSIKKFGRRDLSQGTLVNMTDGGDGVPGWGTPEERSFKAKLRYNKIPKEKIDAHAENEKS